MPVDEAIDALIDTVPALRGERVVSELAGGLTNTNYKVETESGSFVVRISSKDAGLLVTKTVYAIFLTCEVVGEERIRKVRAMLIRRDLLVDFPYPDSLPKLENPWHADRVMTLRAMSKAYQTHPEWFLNLELCV